MNEEKPPESKVEKEKGQTPPQEGVFRVGEKKK